MVMPVMPAEVSFCFTSSSLNGLMIASILFIGSPVGWSGGLWPLIMSGHRTQFTILDIEVQRELPGVGAKANSIDLSVSLVLKPSLDHVLDKHIASEEKVMILLQRIERLVE